MTIQEVRKAGYYTLKKFIISSFLGGSRQVSVSSGVDMIEAKLLVTDWSINESMNSSAVNGIARIYDAVGLLYDFPLIGEEKLTIVYVDFYDNELTEEYMIYSVSDVKPAKEVYADMISYTIHFVSVGKFTADSVIIQRAYNGLISDMVQQVFAEYFQGASYGTKKELTFEETIGADQSLIIPRYNASESMNFFARRSYGGAGLTSSYRFFETRKNYYFATNEFVIGESLFENIPSSERSFAYRYNINKDETPEGQRSAMQSMISFEFPSPVNSLQDIYSGSYNKRTTELDYINREIITTDYNYIDSYPVYNQYMGYKGKTGVGAIHTREFVDSFMRNGKEAMVIKDYPGIDAQSTPALRSNPYYSQLINPSWAVSQHHTSNSMKIKVYGRNDLFPGKVIDIEMDQFRFQQGAIDTRLSGKYMIESIANEFVGDVFYQSLLISRGGVGQ